MAAIEPTRKVEIRPKSSSVFIDVSSFVLDDSTLDLTSGSKISGGRFRLDRSILNTLPNLSPHDEMKVTVGDITSDTLIFDGLLRDGKDEDEKDVLNYPVKSYAILCSDRSTTRVFRDDAGTGDPVEAVKTIIDAELTEINYDSTSIPDKPAAIENFKNERLQNRNIKEFFDFVANWLGRIWYVDENKKLFMVEQSFTDTGYTLEQDVNILGNLVVAYDLKRWANYVSVDGKKFQVGFQDTFASDGTTTEFTLSERPHSLTVTVDGDVKAGSIRGTDFEDDADYLIDMEAPSITFTSAPGTISPGTVVADGITISKIHDEWTDEGSRLEFGTKNKELIDESVESVTSAGEIANNYLTLYKVPIKIYSGKTVWNENVRPLKRVTLLDSNRGINLKVNVIEANFIFGERSFEIRFKLNDFNFTVIDMYEDLVRRVKRLEFNARNEGLQIAKYVFFGANMAFSIHNLHISSEGIGNAAVFDHPDTGFDDASVYMDGVDGGGSLTDEGNVRIVNFESVFVEDFFNTFYKGNGTADWDLDSKRLNMDSSGFSAIPYATYQDFNVFHKNGLTINSIRLTNTEEKFGNDLIKYYIKVDGSTFEEATNNNLLTIANSGTKVELRVFFYGNGGNQTYLSQLKCLVNES